MLLALPFRATSRCATKRTVRLPCRRRHYVMTISKRCGIIKGNTRSFNVRQLLAAIFVLFILAPLCLALQMPSIAVVLVIGVTIIPAFLFGKCCFYRYCKKHHNRSLSFGFKSIRSQINEFKFINRFEFLPEKFKIFCKKISVFHDALFEYKKDTNDYFGDPSYSASILNICYRNRHWYLDRR